MSRPALVPAAALVPALLIMAACTTKGPFPSLAPRAVEKLSMDEPVRETPVIAADPSLAAETSAFLTQARRGQAEFEAVLPATRRSVGAAGAPGTESWIEGQEALSRLEAARALTVTALAELDELEIRRAGLPTNQQQWVELREARETAEALARGQQEQMEQLRAALSSL